MLDGGQGQVAIAAAAAARVQGISVHVTASSSRETHDRFHHGQAVIILASVGTFVFFEHALVRFAKI